jgi:hypothetical protein
MRILPIWLLLLLGAGVLRAQVDAELILEQDQFLRDEPIPVKVRITNRSGQTLHLGEGQDWLGFTVEIPGHGPAERNGQPPVTGAFDLESARVATREVNLQPWFELSQPGRYTISAMVRIKQWDKEISCKAKTMEVMRGTKVWEQEVGIPRAEGLPEARRFILLQANYRKQLKLYLRVSNESDTVAYAVLPLGPLVSFGRPEAQVDDRSDLHVLFQTGARSFVFTETTPDGVIVARHNYDYGARRPTFRLNETGKIVVQGGVRRFNPQDLPPITVTTSSETPALTPPPESSPSLPPSPDKDAAPPRK